MSRPDRRDGIRENSECSKEVERLIDTNLAEVLVALRSTAGACAAGWTVGDGFVLFRVVPEELIFPVSAADDAAAFAQAADEVESILAIPTRVQAGVKGVLGRYLFDDDSDQ